MEVQHSIISLRVGTADELDLKSSAIERVGANPTGATNRYQSLRWRYSTRLVVIHLQVKWFGEH